jgi:hypothetical protein
MNDLSPRGPGPEDAARIDAVVALGEQLRAAAGRRSELLAAAEGAAAAVDAAVSEPEPDVELAPVLVHRPGARRRRAAALTAAAAVVAGGVIGSVVVFGGTPSPVAAGVEIERSDGVVTVVIDEQADASQVALALREAGVDATVEEQGTGPSRVGRFVGIAGSSPELAEDSADGSIARFRAGDRVTLYVGVAAEEGEAYDAATDAFAPGEPFAGLDDLLGRPWAEVEPVLQERAAAEGIELQLVGPGTGTLGTVQMISATQARALS